MNKKLKAVVRPEISFRRGEFKNDQTMTQKLPAELKRRILDYLKSAEPGIMGDMPLIDPVTGVVYERTNVLREKDGFEWSTAEIYMIEHYDVALTNDFLRLFNY